MDVKLIHVLDNSLDVPLCRWTERLRDRCLPANVVRVYEGCWVTCLECLDAKRRYFRDSTATWRGRGVF